MKSNHQEDLDELYVAKMFTKMCDHAKVKDSDQPKKPLSAKVTQISWPPWQDKWIS